MTTAITSFDGEYRFLSNFWPAEIAVNSMSFGEQTYKTVEHAFQALKAATQLHHDTVQRQSTPGKAKYWGRKIQRRSDWEDIKITLMKHLVRRKFKQHPDLAAKLLATGDAQLIEGNTWGDRIWGCVMNGQGEWEGQNLLGIILMEIRTELREGLVEA